MLNPGIKMVANNKTSQAVSILLYDRWLVFAAIGLFAVGLLMVASSSMVIAESRFHQPFHYLLRQLIYLFFSLIAASFVFKIPIRRWEKHSQLLLLLSWGLLLLVLVPGLGKQVNGSTRWISLGLLNVQVSEFAKLFLIVYLAGYLKRHNNALRQQIGGFIKPMGILTVAVLLLLMEPDFGASVVLLATAIGMMFLAGMRLRYFLGLLLVIPATLVLVIIVSPYRLQRLLVFLDPWANQFGSGYQLIQSLIAFGQGGWLGVGLGNSIQKLYYLPEAHTDFLFAVLAEEFGFVGVVGILLLFCILIWRAFRIAYHACLQQYFFAAYLAYGCALCIALQVLINVGVNVGVLPTKGLTLPFMSYGGSSMMIHCVMLSLLLRIDYETRLLPIKYFSTSSIFRRHKK